MPYKKPMSNIGFFYALFLALILRNENLGQLSFISNYYY